MKNKLEHFILFTMFTTICALATFGGMGIDSTMNASETTYMNREAIQK